MFDPTYNIGNIATIVVILGAIIGFAYSLRATAQIHDVRFDMVNQTMDRLEKSQEKMAEALIQVAVQKRELESLDARLTSQGRRLDEQIARFNKYLDSQVLSHIVAGPPGE
jgi:uncharacterized membrane protein (DUF106 family)